MATGRDCALGKGAEAMVMRILAGPIWGDEQCYYCESPADVCLHLEHSDGVDENYLDVCAEHTRVGREDLEEEMAAWRAQHGRE